MGQQEVYDFLGMNKDYWFTSKEIAKELRISFGSVTTSVKKLKNCGLINFRITDSKLAGRSSYQYCYKE